MQEASNITTSGAVLATSQKLSKELLEAENEDTKLKIQEMYALQNKKWRDRGSIKEETDPLAIQEAIEDLLLALMCIDALIKQHTRFAVSFLCTGPDPLWNWEITSLFCHPEETPQGNTFADLFPTEENVMLVAFQDYAELLFSVEMRNPISEHTAAQPLDYLSDVETEHGNSPEMVELEGKSAGESSGFESGLDVDQALGDITESKGEVTRDNDREGDDGWNRVGGLVEGEENVNDGEGIPFASCCPVDASLLQSHPSLSQSHASLSQNHASFSQDTQASRGNMSLGQHFGSRIAPSLLVPSFDTIGGYSLSAGGFSFSDAMQDTGSFSATMQDARSFSGGDWNFEGIGLDVFATNAPTSNEHSTGQNNQNIPELCLPAPPPLDLPDTTQSAEPSTKPLNSKSMSVGDKLHPKPKLVKQKPNAPPGAPVNEALMTDHPWTVPKTSWAIPPRVVPVQKIPPQAAPTGTIVTPKAVDPMKPPPKKTTPAASQHGPLPSL
ncbi:hypothetical protein PAXRUDRAFT_16344 [Paxillus rubicundulus Ve08.2h10]|uniref:Uncharacterized protein n=1 Tax=Paxillus rubicundulus Ve08.2h10 TaxID=930991 RepID=A0A0D0CVF2_9AGAM|nr:hypothetical protein PAXRUDRAFT_16344 [Paxillus rubicundulus Ve08.2h10]